MRSKPITTKKFNKSPLAAAMALPLVFAGLNVPVMVTADELAIEEITVTARKRSETLQDVPFSVQALSENQMRERGAVDLESLSANVAGFTVQNLGPGQSQVAIRGISAGQIVRDQPGVKEQVGIYLDESVISLSLFTPDLDFYDLNRVEVLRGPQGTLFGSGSLSGTVRYITNEPELDEMQGSIQAGINTISDGDTGGELKGMINIPLSDKAALRLVGYTTEYAGYIDAVRPNGSGGFTVDDDINGGNRYGIRASLLFEPNEKVRMKPRIIYQEIEIDGFNREDDFNILANNLTTTRPTIALGDYEQFIQLDEEFSDEFTLADFTLEVDMGPVTLTAVSSYTERDVLVLRDATALTASITGGSFGDPESVYTLNAPLSDRTDVEMVTQEIRFSSNTDGMVDWVVGVFYSDIERNYSQRLPVTGYEAGTGTPTAGPLAPTDVLFFSEIPYDFEQIAVFGELDFHLTDQLTLTAGLRYYDFEETRVLNFDGIFADQTVGERGKTSSDGVSPRLMLNYEVSDDMSLNAQVSKGFRLGGINDPLNVSLCTAQDLATFGGNDSFEDEELTNFEVGTKMTVMDGRGSFAMSLFHSKIDDLQTTVEAGSCSSRVIFNVPEATSTGIEFEFFANFTEHFEMAFTGSLISAELGSTVTSTDSLGNVTVVAGLEDGNDLPTVPDVQGAVSGTYNFDVSGLEGAATLTYQYVGSRHTQTTDLDPATGTVSLFTNVGDIPAANGTLTIDPELNSYTVANFRVAVSAEQWETAFFINNLTDKRAELSLDRERGLRARIAHRINQPRTYGVTVNYNF